MRVLLTCGGTGGHITPALAIADMLRENLADCHCLFVGTVGGMEEAMVTRAGYEIRTLRVAGLSRKNPLEIFRTARLMRAAVREATALVRAYRPDIIIGTGSYACYPTLAAGAALGVPTAVHESNAAPGLAVRLLAGRLDRVWLGFAVAKKGLPKGAKPLVVGNPIGVSFGRVREPLPLPQGCSKMVLSFGGSLGAAKLNDAVLSLMAAEREIPGVYHLHGTGARDFARCEAVLAERGLAGDPHIALSPFLSDMPRLMASADLVICRAGAMSIAELAAAGRAAILVPSPNVTGDHQTKNAAVLAAAGAALMIEESFLGNGALEGAVKSLLTDTARRQGLAREIGRFASPDVGRKIFLDVLALVRAKKGRFS
ncbi:MAG: UDP-N-acetylglucosamine--N-acetylmuramyl-(pentapeptide) pyrophosphoryl-undecaprenol N-acetylglucosamine transferase [Clostridia bacterium]|nr:UDP-N-acetylglucosamine--N-acetylmuramyl-(pentapeptide) pyrophosphoryl-undecaprenol N-acetylglucosamine transferase [Clostridia bacterium]